MSRHDATATTTPSVTTTPIQNGGASATLCWETGTEDPLMYEAMHPSTQYSSLLLNTNNLKSIIISTSTKRISAKQ